MAVKPDSVLVLLITLAIFYSTATGSSLLHPSGENYGGDDYTYDDDYNINNSATYELLDEPQDIRVPEFVTTSKTVLVNEGGNIKLPCIVDELGSGLVVIWKRGNKIIALGDRPYELEDPRVKVEKVKNGNLLVIRMVDKKDAGEYICQVPSVKTIELKHTVKIRVGPAVSPVPASGLLTVMGGDLAELGCNVSRGDPLPEVTWRRKNRRLPSGEESIAGLSLTFLSATRHHSGIYVCSAENGWGSPASVEIRLDVQHAPLIESEETLVDNIGGGRDLEITCIVHSSPTAKVTWYKDGAILSNKHNVISKRSNKHSLLLPDVNRITRRGSYKCKAVNNIGDAEFDIQITEDGKMIKLPTSDNSFQEIELESFVPTEKEQELVGQVGEHSESENNPLDSEQPFPKKINKVEKEGEKSSEMEIKVENSVEKTELSNVDGENDILVDEKTISDINLVELTDPAPKNNAPHSTEVSSGIKKVIIDKTTDIEIGEDMKKKTKGDVTTLLDQKDNEGKHSDDNDNGSLPYEGNTMADGDRAAQLEDGEIVDKSVSLKLPPQEKSVKTNSAAIYTTAVAAFCFALVATLCQSL